MRPPREAGLSAGDRAIASEKSRKWLKMSEILVLCLVYGQ
jgi:hypothetical protein